MSTSIKLLAIDPPGCGCTECLIGEYVPMSEATPGQIRKLMRGVIADHTNSVWTAVRRGDELHVEARGHTWVIEDWDHGDPAIDEDGLARFDSAWALTRYRGDSR